MKFKLIVNLSAAMLSAAIYASCAHAGAENAEVDSVKNHNPYVADPTIFVEDGKYYLLGTDGRNSDGGFPMYISENLDTFKLQSTPALRLGDSFGTKWFWAPQIIKKGDGYMLFYTADEQVAYAYSDHPEGPYKDGHMVASTIRTIDPFLFTDTDGKNYLYHVRLDGGNKIYVVEMDESCTEPNYSTLTLCIEATEPWENTDQAEWPVTEGPTVVRHGDKYVMLYSANDFRNPDYCVAVAEADSPYGPWKKQSQPLLNRMNIGENGVGHGDLFKDAQGGLHYVFHLHNSNKEVAPRRTAIVDLDSETLSPIKGSYRLIEAK